MSVKLLPRGVALSKRIFDLVLTIPGLIVLLPFLALLALLVWLVEGRPIFFRHERPGLHGEIFTLHKFRTMRELTDKNGNLLPDGKRISRLGHFLRATSLDELPELLNVIRGEMSLVGPRPLLVSYLERYTPEQARRHDVLPGITGWAQVNGRNNLSWEEKFQMDVWYVDNASIWLDIKILGMTFLKVIQREGISQPGQATSAIFQGSKKKKRKKSPSPPR